MKLLKKERETMKAERRWETKCRQW